jgi:hypothetical protein
MMYLEGSQLTEESIIMSTLLAALCPLAAVAGPPAMRARHHLLVAQVTGQGGADQGPHLPPAGLFIDRTITH